MIKWKKLIICILIPNILGFLGSLIGNVQNGFNEIVKPDFTPPSIVFPIAWTVLYILMGVSTYLIIESKNTDNNRPLILYSIQLILNASWTFFFFNLKWFLFSFILIIIILILVILMTTEFYKIKPLAAYLQIPYILWLIFAAILSYNVYLLN
ncbi:MAG: tryptophan-rich sensory protein [Bacilli bacterium]|nr:tryptophan-rich sensory protein [Bacilli bacterium]